MVMRSNFDQFLINKAVDAGATLRQGTLFKSLSGTFGSVKIDTSEGTFYSKIVAGCDGVNGKVSKHLNIPTPHKRMAALEAELFFSNPAAINKKKGFICFDFGIVPNGYAWIFPKSNHLSIGVASNGKKISLKSSLFQYIKFKGLQHYHKVENLKGHLIPYGIRKYHKFSCQHGLLVGDAAGLVDPITGEGIYYALKEAHIASKVITQCLSADRKTLVAYDHLLKQEFYGELRCAEKLAYLIYQMPLLGNMILKNFGQIIGEKQLEVVAGKTGYEDIYAKVFKPHTALKIIKTFWNKTNSNN